MNDNNKIDYIEFPASSIKQLGRTKTFFNTVFGWEYKEWGDDYIDTKDSGVSSGVSADNPSKAPLPVVRTQDIEMMYNRVKSAGGVITREIFVFPGGRRFHFREPGGSELAVWSE